MDEVRCLTDEEAELIIDSLQTIEWDSASASFYTARQEYRALALARRGYLATEYNPNGSGECSYNATTLGRTALACWRAVKAYCVV